jgi:inosine-uridine nucleoside N-ribohydrolase
MKPTRIVALLLCAAACVSCSKADRAGAAGVEETKTDIIICTDCGVEIDDQWMILHLLRVNGFRVVAIFSSHCGDYDYLPSPQAEASMRAIRELLDVSGNEEVPVFVGSSRPLETRHSIIQETANRIFELVRDYSSERRMTVVLSGPATDIGSALVKHPEIEDKIEIVATAFQSREKGMSFNVGNDIPAWQVILERDVPIVICPGPVAGAFFSISRESVGTVLNIETPVGAYLYDKYIGWIDANGPLAARVTGREDTWPIWDEILVSHLLGLTKTEKSLRPAMLQNGDLDYGDASTREPVEWIVEADSKKTWEHHRASLN